MEKNTIWAIVLSSIVLIGSLLLQNYFFPPQKAVVTEQEVANSNTEVVIEQEIPEEKTIQTVVNATDSIPEEQITVNTGKAKIILTNKGGDIISYELLEHNDKDGYVQMADSISEMNRACSVSFGNAVNNIINENFVVTKISDLIYSFSKEFTVKNVDGSSSTFVLTKKYLFLFYYLSEGYLVRILYVCAKSFLSSYIILAQPHHIVNQGCIWARNPRITLTKTLPNPLSEL